MDREYVGIDLHRARSVVVRKAADGAVLSTQRITNSPDELAAAVGAAGENPVAVLEATYGWYWAVDLLNALGAEVHLAAPSGLNWGQRRVKNDERDAIDLVDMLRLGRLPEAWIAPPPVRELRELVRYRSKLVGLRTGLKAQVHAVMAKEGVPAIKSDMFGVTGRALLNTMPVAGAYQLRVQSLLELIAALDAQISTIEPQIHDRLSGHDGYRAVQQLHGVGPVLAAIFVAEIGDVTRFPTARHLCSWAGLTPKHRESDTKVQRGPITKQGSRLVRWAAIEAISKTHGGSKLRHDFHAIAERRGKFIARAAVGRKLLTLVFYALRDGQVRSLAAA